MLRKQSKQYKHNPLNYKNLRKIQEQFRLLTLNQTQISKFNNKWQQIEYCYHKNNSNCVIFYLCKTFGFIKYAENPTELAAPTRGSTRNAPSRNFANELLLSDLLILKKCLTIQKCYRMSMYSLLSIATNDVYILFLYFRSWRYWHLRINCMYFNGMYKKQTCWLNVWLK